MPIITLTTDPLYLRLGEYLERKKIKSVRGRRQNVCCETVSSRNKATRKPKQTKYSVPKGLF